MPRRSDARKTAIQMLYLIDVNPDAPLEQIRNAIADDLPKADLREFAEKLVAGVRADLSQIDQLIEGVAQNWRIERMAPTDRNVIRLAIYEMHHMGTPSAVAINEAVELAKAFGTGNSASFVNGIIDRLTPEALKPTPAIDAAEPNVSDTAPPSM
jgi:N utilization substance protein B